THPDSSVPVLGASGAVAAIIAAYAVIYPTERVITIVPIIIIPLFVPVPAILFAALWFGFQVLQGSHELIGAQMASGVAWWAHIGGFAFGALFGLAARALMPGSRTDRKSTRLNSSHVKISYAVFCLKKKKRAGGKAGDCTA